MLLHPYMLNMLFYEHYSLFTFSFFFVVGVANLIKFTQYAVSPLKEYNKVFLLTIDLCFAYTFGPKTNIYHRPTRLT